MRAKDIVADLAEEAALKCIATSSKPEPGQTVLNLHERERKILQLLKSDDLKEVRWLRLV